MIESQWFDSLAYARSGPMQRGREAGGHQDSCRKIVAHFQTDIVADTQTEIVAHSQTELEAVNRMDRAGPSAVLNAASRERFPLGVPA